MLLYTQHPLYVSLLCLLIVPDRDGPGWQSPGHAVENSKDGPDWKSATVPEHGVHWCDLVDFGVGVGERAMSANKAVCCAEAKEWGYGNGCPPRPCGACKCKHGIRECDDETPCQCSGCNQGYTLQLKGNTIEGGPNGPNYGPFGHWCKPNQCCCPNGIAETVETCPGFGFPKCAACSPGYRLVDLPGVDAGSVCIGKRHSQTCVTPPCVTPL